MLRWFQRKRYQYEVTFSLYMLTPTEKFIFNSILFLLLSLLIIAASLYLPEHLSIIANRILYYVSGNQQSLAVDAHKMAGSPNAPLGDDVPAMGRAYMEP
ncbi:uncharacterized protein yc1106_08044 [Curvularia clavata]|uniref:Uncharacterized protein n=1 Tax=Curvularia clavata TaxID=95742 RepID=A0A9Q9DWA3_CURCL|nr:uncharacterized protein yc1106_08044 [Curvularia clavata]